MRRKRLGGHPVDSEHDSHFLSGGAEEWLRRIALGPAMARVPDPIAFALVAMGFAQRTEAGAFEATAAGRAYLDAQGIAHRPAPRYRHWDRRHFYK
jgi:hypothetical protein